MSALRRYKRLKRSDVKWQNAWRVRMARKVYDEYQKELIKEKSKRVSGMVAVDPDTTGDGDDLH